MLVYLYITEDDNLGMSGEMVDEILVELLFSVPRRMC